MARKIYIGSSVSSRNVSDIYIGISGRSRKVTKGYIGENSAARLFYPRYAWDKYTIGRKTVYGLAWYSDGAFTLNGDARYGGFRLAQDYTFDDSTGTITFIDIVFYEENDPHKQSIPYGTYYATMVDFSGYGSTTILTTDCDESTRGTSYRLEYRGVAYYNNSIFEGRHSTSVEDGPGDFVETVYSNESDAYPRNDILGDYWYIRK